MRTQETIMVPTVVKTYCCDCCDFEWKDNQPRGRYKFPIYTCQICNLDICEKCTTIYDEDGNPEDWFRPDMLACPQCREFADKIWSVALHVVERHDSMEEVVAKVIKHWDSKYKFVWEVLQPKQAPRIVSVFPDLL